MAWTAAAGFFMIVAHGVGNFAQVMLPVGRQEGRFRRLLQGIAFHPGERPIDEALLFEGR